MEEHIENRENHMEKHYGSNRQGKKKFGVIGMSTRGGGIEKVVALGGALAVAGLIALFSIKKSSKKDSNIKNKDLDTMNVSAQDNESCTKEEDEGEALSFIQHQNSCGTNHGTSELAITEIESSELVTLGENTIECEIKDSIVDDADQESGNHGDIEDNETNPMDGVEIKNNALANLGIETFEITIEDKAINVDPKENPTLPSSITTQLDDEEVVVEEEYSLMRSSFSIEDERIDEEEYSPKGSPFSTEEEEEEEIGENVSEEGTWSSSPELNMEVIWPAEIMGVYSSTESKEIMNVSLLESEMKSKEEDITMSKKIETHHYLSKTTFDENNKKKGTEELVVMDVRKVQQQHSSKRQTWVLFGLVMVILVLLANCLLQSNYLSNSVSFAFPMK